MLIAVIFEPGDAIDVFEVQQCVEHEDIRVTVAVGISDDGFSRIIECVGYDRGLLLIVRNEFITVFDTVYNPKETKLLVEAKEKGCTIVYGYKMLLYQAAMQFELFTGLKAPLAAMESALTHALGGKRNATHFDRR